MEGPSVFEGVYSDSEYSEPETGDSDFDPADLGDGSDAETQPINEDYDADVDTAAIPRTAQKPAWVKPPPGPLAVKVIKIVAMIHGNGLTVAEFLDAFSWGDRDSQPVSLCGKVPSSQAFCGAGINLRGQGIRSRGVQRPHREVFERELESLADIFESPAGDDIKEESLTSISFSEMVKLVKNKSPNLWAMLFRLGRTKSQEERNPHKNPANLFAIYFKFRGLSAKGFDTLHAIGLTMSNKWMGNAVDRISAEGMAVMKQLMNKFPWIMSYDNALIPFRVFSQRIDKKSSQGSGTAGTVYIKCSAKLLPIGINHMVQEFRREGMKNPLTAKDIFKISRLADSRRTPHIIFLILSYLFDSPEFDFSTYSGKDDPLLQKPAWIRQLPCGKDEITLYYLLGSLNIPEASYEDNARLIIEWLKQLGFSAPDAQKKLGLEQGWGLSAAFDILRRKGLQTAQTQGTFFHDINETLHIIAEAQIRELWLQIRKTNNHLADLQNKTPQDLFNLAEQIFSGHASSAALVHMELKKDRADEVKVQSIMFLRDVLPYILLRSAVKHGDVGFMEDMIPFMLFRFVGGKNNNYAGEMLKLLQGLNCGHQRFVTSSGIIAG
ncbi:hypothetical protein DFH07DRAFT_785521 [Mycena maculata]|uniref:DUF6589 domain-containing protein n=1 Tax=Mycena maculata TaxID=230809 RepID=A0AAD7MGJ7_9AGAR|nr:hypothetical protein DFH07DRAFT_785521 [Mycena maculata]